LLGETKSGRNAKKNIDSLGLRILMLLTWQLNSSTRHVGSPIEPRTSLISLPRQVVSQGHPVPYWIPACAGMTALMNKYRLSAKLKLGCLVGLRKFALKITAKKMGTPQLR